MDVITGFKAVGLLVLTSRQQSLGIASGFVVLARIKRCFRKVGRCVRVTRFVCQGRRRFILGQRLDCRLPNNFWGRMRPFALQSVELPKLARPDRACRLHRLRLTQQLLSGYIIREQIVFRSIAEDNCIIRVLGELRFPKRFVPGKQSGRVMPGRSNDVPRKKL